MADYYPPVGFRFRVTGLGGQETDISFQSVSGLNAQLQTESLKEGGENTNEHTLPLRVKYTDLVLKRGTVAKGASTVTTWLKDAFDNFTFSPLNIEIQLIGEDDKAKALMVWKVHHVLPKNWKFADLNAERGEVFLETLELSYNFFIFDKP